MSYFKHFYWQSHIVRYEVYQLKKLWSISKNEGVRAHRAPLNPTLLIYVTLFPNIDQI